MSKPIVSKAVFDLMPKQARIDTLTTLCALGDAKCRVYVDEVIISITTGLSASTLLKRFTSVEGTYI